MSKLNTLKTNGQRFIALLVTNLVILPTFYRYMATKQKRKQILLGMIPLILFYSLITFPVSSVLFPLTAVSVVVMTLPLFLFASAVDPFIGWIRGEVEKPKTLFGQVLIIHLWSLVSAVIPVGIAISGFIAFGDTSPESLENGSGPGMIFMAFGVLVGIHLFVALREYPNIRTPQKLISWLIYGIMFWAPAILQLIRMASE